MSKIVIKKKGKQQMEQAETIKHLMDSEQKFRLLLETSLDAVLVGLSDGSIAAANIIACEMMGHQEKELNNTGISELFDHDDPRVPIFLAEQANTGIARGELFLRKGDGSIFPAELSASEFEDSGGYKFTVLIIRVLTKHKCLQNALHNANQKISTVLTSITDIYFTWDRKGRFTDLNQQAEVVMGKGRDEVIGKRLAELFPKTKKEYMQFYWTAMANDSHMFFDALFLFGRWFEAHAYPSDDGLSVYFKDITKRKRAEKALRLKTQNLEEVNAALKVLLKQLEE